jgi:hypothetical protein
MEWAVTPLEAENMKMRLLLFPPAFAAGVFSLLAVGSNLVAALSRPAAPEVSRNLFGFGLAMVISSALTFYASKGAGARALAGTVVAMGGGFLLGGAIGCVGPMLLAPTSSQGPLLMFLLAPVGALLAGELSVLAFSRYGREKARDDASRADPNRETLP